MIPQHAARRRTYNRACCFALLFAVSIVTTVRAQTEAPEAGARVRLTTSCAADRAAADRTAASTCRVVGELLRIESGAVSITTDGSSATYGLDALRRLETSRGTRSHRLVGSLVGLVVGSGATYVVLHQGGSTSKCDRSANQDALSSRECFGLVALGGAVGAGTGAILGGLIKSERWEEVALDRLRVSVSPDRLRIGMLLVR